MSEYYTHLLIAKPKDFVPTSNQVQRFLQRIVEKEVVPSVDEILLFTTSNRLRTGLNPFTGETVSFPMKERATLSDTTEISGAISNLPDFEIHIAGIGRPMLPPLPIEFDGDYHVTVRCRVSAVTRSTSYVADWDQSGNEVPFIGTPCPPDSTMGYFSDPNDGPVLQIANAGCARFWIEFGIGKNLLPIISNHDLNILDEEIVSIAEQSFGVDFVQGYQWG